MGARYLHYLIKSHFYCYTFVRTFVIRSSFFVVTHVMTFTVLLVCCSAEDAVEKQHTSSDSSGPVSVCLEGNGHPVKKHEV